MTSDDTWVRLLALPASDRIRYLHSTVFWELPHQMRLLELLESRFDMPDLDRPRSLVLTAESGMGKTATLQELKARHPDYRNDQTGTLIQPVLYAEVPLKPSPEQLLAEVLKTAGLPVRSKSHPSLYDYFTHQIRTLAPGLIILDELQRVADLPSRDTNNALEALKWMARASGRPLVAVAVPQVLPFFKRDTQLARRFQHVQLEAWSFDGGFDLFVEAVLRNMPMREGFDVRLHTDREILHGLFEKCEANTGALIALIQDAAERVLRGGREFITPTSFEL